METDIEKIKNNLIPIIKKYIEIIKEEYKDYTEIPDNIDLKKYVHIEDTGTISLFIRGGHFYFPTDAFKVLEIMKKMPGFGSNKNHKTCNKDNMIINDNTYITFIKHIYLKGLTAEEYY